MRFLLRLGCSALYLWLAARELTTYHEPPDPAWFWVAVMYLAIAAGCLLWALVPVAVDVWRYEAPRKRTAAEERAAQAQLDAWRAAHGYW